MNIYIYIYYIYIFIYIYIYSQQICGYDLFCHELWIYHDLKSVVSNPLQEILLWDHHRLLANMSKKEPITNNQNS